MPRRLAAISLATLCATLAGQALAPGSPPPRAGASASKVVRLPSAAQCVKGSTVRLIFSPPAQASLAALSVRVGASEVLQLANLTGAGSLVVKVPRPGVRVSVTGSTSTGSFFTARRAYERCVPGETHPAPSPTSTPTPTGGGGGG
jgi:hypothetical protein